METQKISTDLSSLIASGKTREEVYIELITMGYKVDEIQEAYGSAKSEKDGEDAQKRTIKIIVTISAILVGAGIFSFIAANWQEMGKFIKIAVILFFMLAFYAAGWYLKEKKDYPKTGNALILLGLITYGAGIFLVAQIFHIRSNWPDGFILWMFGAIAISFVLEMTSLLYFAGILGIISVIGHPFGIFDNFAVYNPFLLTSTFLLIAATAVTFISGWMIRKKLPEDIKNIY